MTVEDLLAVNVSSVSRRPEALSEAAGNVFLIRNQTVPAIGAQSLPELLRMAPNLFVAQSSSSTWAVNARGFVRSNAYSNKLLVMVDGRTVYSPLFSNVFWDSTAVFLPDLQSIEVISGPAGSTWGANAVNGVINIQSKSARDTVGNLVTLSGGTEARTFGVRAGTRFGSTGALRVYAQGGEYDATRDTFGRDDGYDKWHSLQTGFRSDWGSAATGEFTVQGDAFAGRFKNGAAPQTTNDNANLLARWSRDLSPDSHLWVRAYQDYSKRDTGGALTEISRATDLEFQHRIDFGRAQNFLWGADYRHMSDATAHTLGFVILPAKLQFALGSVFAQHVTPLGTDALRLTTGFRAEHNHFSGWEYQPSVKLGWHLSRQMFWASASRATRIPSRLDTGFFAPQTPPYFVAGGPDFTSEIVRAYELGWRGRPSKDLSLTATVYYHDYDHLRSVELRATPIVVTNGVEGHSYGVELFADWDALPWWRVRLGGFTNAQRTQVKAGRTDSERGLGESSYPDYQLQFRNTFRIGDDLTLWTSLRRVAEVPGFENGAYSYVPGYTEFDTNLVWRLRPDLEVSLGGRNLLHPAHPEIGATAIRRQIPRTVQAGLRWTF
jgi:iron complex outermembrane receptor protein